MIAFFGAPTIAIAKTWQLILQNNGNRKIYYIEQGAPPMGIALHETIPQHYCAFQNPKEGLIEISFQENNFKMDLVLRQWD